MTRCCHGQCCHGQCRHGQCCHGQRRHGPRRRRAGYTLIEVMMAMGVLTAGAVGIMAMIQASTRGNLEAREMTTGNQLSQRWVERLRRDALSWQRSTRVLDPTLLARTSYLQLVPNPGGVPAWFVPVPPVGSPDTANFDFYGRNTAAPADSYYCTNVRLEWLYVGRAMRADVRVWWLRRASGTNTDPTRVALAQCAPGMDPTLLGDNDWRVRMTFASTVLRHTPMPP